MKKLLLIATLLFSYIGFAQFTVATSAGTPINDGDVFTFNTTNYPDNSLEFVVTNTTNQDMDMVINVESITNTDGSGMEICFGLCYSGVTPHTSYPTDSPYHLAANSSSEPHGNHILNNATNGSMVLEYVLKFTQVDGSGNQIGTPVTITYKYDQTASVNDNTLNNVKIFPTLVKNKILSIDTNQDLSVSIVDIQGKTVKETTTTVGLNQIDVSTLNSGNYFILLSNNEGKEDFKKIIIK